MDYSRFINSITDNITHHGKFLLHYVNYKTLDEELRLYRFADFIKFAKEDLKKYEDYDLKDNILYNFQMFIHAPDKELSANDIKQHSTTMTVMYRIFGGHNLNVKKGEKIKVVIYDHTRQNVDLKITSTYTTIKNPKHLFKFKENDIVKVLEQTGGIKTLTIVKSYQMPYFNFSTNNIVPTDKWKIPKSLQSTIHHSISYIVNYKLYYKFPDDTKNQFINFSVYLYKSKIKNQIDDNNDVEQIIYHRCMLAPELSKSLEHYNGKCCFGSKGDIIKYETKPIVEDANLVIKPIKHYYFTEDFTKFDFKKNPAMKELQKICNIQKNQRLSYMEQYNILSKYISSLAEQSAKFVHTRC